MPPVVIGGLLGGAIVLNRRQLLPPKYNYDGDRIQAIAQGFDLGYGDNSFERTGEAYRFLGLADAAGLASLVSFGAFLLLFWIGLAVSMRNANVSLGIAQVLALVGPIVGAVFLGYYSKDVFVLPVIAAVLLGRKGWRDELLPIILALIYAALFRSYWFLVVGLYVAYRSMLRRGVDARSIVAMMICAILIASLALNIVTGVGPNHFREMANAERDGMADAATMIEPVFASTAAPLQAIDNVLVLFGLMVPIPLAAAGGLGHLLAAVTIGGLWIVLWQRASSWGGNDRVIVQRCAALVLAYLTTQAMFEPDYGSSIRHISPLIPLIAILATDGKRPGSEFA